MSRLPSQGRLMSSHSQNSVLFDNNDQSQQYDDYDVNQPLSSLRQPQPQIFNQSFYKEKQLVTQGSTKQETFLSMEFIKKYFAGHELQKILTKAIKSVMDNQYLPQNPYNVLYRVLLSQTTIPHTVTYQQANGIKKLQLNISKPQTKKQQDPELQQSNICLQICIVLTKRTIIAEKQFFISSKMVRYLNPNAIYNLWNELFSRQRLNVMSGLVQKHGFAADEYFVSMGGPILLLLEGVNTYSEKDDVVRLGLRASERLRQSVYASGGEMVKVGCFVTVPESQLPLDETTLLTNFINFVIDQSLQQMQSSPSNGLTMFMTKLSFSNPSSQSLTQFSPMQLINQRLKTTKQLTKLLLQHQLQIKAHYYCKTSKKLASLLFEQYLTLTKTYILINTTQANLKQSPSSRNIANKKNTTTGNGFVRQSEKRTIYTPCRLSFIFEHVFLVPDYYEHMDKAYGLNEIPNEEIYEQYRREKLGQCVGWVKLYELTNLTYQMFYMSMYDMQLSQHSGRLLAEAMDAVINTPANIFAILAHKLTIAKLLLNPSVTFLPSAGDNQQQMYRLINEVCQEVYQLEKRGDYPCVQMGWVLKAIRRLCAVVLGSRRVKVMVIRLVVDNLLLLCRAVTRMAVAVAFSAGAVLPNYLGEVVKKLAATEDEKLAVESFVTYQTYLSNIKDFPKRSLYLPTQTKRYKQQLSIPQSQAKDLIVVKYIQHYQLYELVYKFYWSLVEGKKLMYPVVKVMEEVKAKAVRLEVRLMAEEMQRIRRNNVRGKVEGTTTLSRVNGVEVYELAHGVNSQLTGYSFAKQSLNPSALTQYKKLLLKFLPYLISQQTTTLDHPTKRYLPSIKPLPFLNNFSQQTGGIYVAKLYIDCLIKKPLKKSQLYSFIHTQLTQFMQQCDNDEIGVLGVYAAWRHVSNEAMVYHGDEVYGSDGESEVLRYDSKRKLVFESVFRFLEHVYTREIQVRMVWKDDKIVQACNVTFNYYYMAGNYQEVGQTVGGSSINTSLKPFTQVKNHHDRVFYTKGEIIEWAAINDVANKKKRDEATVKEKLGSKENVTSLESIRSGTKGNGKDEEVVGSMRKILLEEEVAVEELLLEGEDEDGGKGDSGMGSSNGKANSKKPRQLTTLTQLRSLSPSFSNLEQSHHQIINLLYILTYLKQDNRNRFSFTHIYNQVTLIQYYLLDQCLKDDRFITLEGVSVEIGNLIGTVKGYLRQRKDNLGRQDEILWMERIVYRITGLVKMMVLAVSVDVKTYLEMKRGEE